MSMIESTYGNYVYTGRDTAYHVNERCHLAGSINGNTVTVQFYDGCTVTVSINDLRYVGHSASGSVLRFHVAEPDLATVDTGGCVPSESFSCSLCERRIVLVAREHDWMDPQYTYAGGEVICWTCRIRKFDECVSCGVLINCDELTYVNGGYGGGGGGVHCEGCQDANAWWCDRCDEWYVDGCDHNHTYTCDDCGAEYDQDDDHYCEQCDCEAPRQRFQFPANGDGTIGNDERLTVTLPAGVIDESGLKQIRRVLIQMTRGYAASFVVDEMEPMWQTRRGNFTKRLSSAVWKQHGIKLDQDVLTEVGNIARQHTVEQSVFEVEFTRNLNLGAHDFYHESSCWWGSYSKSRCCLKSWGGIGMRTFDADGEVTGRAWVQPLDEDLQPTHRTIGAHAYVVYNRYGELEGWAATRILAYLTGMTSRRVTLDARGQYVNDGSAHLVADAATCADHENLSYDHDEHDQLDADQIHRQESAA